MSDFNINIEVNEELYLKNPDSTKLGKKLISHSIILINELGFELFTFKKLAQDIGSTESSIYRYFSCKHQLLAYLVFWYWRWVAFKLRFGFKYHKNVEEKLNFAIETITKDIVEDVSIAHVDETLLHKIIINESLKAHHTVDVDKENNKGFFKSYKTVVKMIIDLILEINPTYNYAPMLVSSVIEGSHQQRFFQEHLPALTCKDNHLEDGKDIIVEFYTQMVFNQINLKK